MNALNYSLLVFILLFHSALPISASPVEARPGQDLYAKVTPRNGSVNRATSKGLRTIHDPESGITFTNRIGDRFAPAKPANRLCDGAKNRSGELKQNSKTIRELLGPNLSGISVLRVTNFETQELFSLAAQAIADALQKSPKTIYGYEPWANAVSPEFVGRLEYSDGRTGELEMAYGYICFQDKTGLHWWARFTSPEDLNLQTVTGVLGFQAGLGYFITTASGSRVWLKMSEDKILVRQLDSLLSKKVDVKGELKKVPANVTTSLPAGSQYLNSGFTITADAH